MELIIGGSYQGKLEYVRQKLKKEEIRLWEEEILQGGLPDGLHRLMEKTGGVKVINGLHLLVKNALEAGQMQKLEEQLMLLISENPALIIICDEVGCGVVPINEKECIWREAVGRLLCSLAERADGMERIVAGIPVRIK